MDRFVDRNPLYDERTQMVMDNMGLPVQVKHLVPGIPPDTRNWAQFKQWVSRTNVPIPNQQKLGLREIQSDQFKHIIKARDRFGAPNTNALGGLPPNPPISEFTPQQLQRFRQELLNFTKAPAE